MINTATELGQAYVQIMPSAKGIKGSIEKELGGEATSAGKSAGSKIATAIKGAIVAAGIGKIIGTALTEGGNLQQSLGGVETLFKDSADKVKQYANEAYRTAGLSANDYMENVTSFSASLLQSMGGDTEKAAEKANMAMVDMSDNANKFGSDMESIQNAYQGFAKQNYTMLDNLKLGYGGTKAEMERLLADASKLTGVKYDINNLADVYDAIHAVQVELGVTGTTALESAETLSGSFASMKSAFSNFLGNLALGQDVTTSLQALAETVSIFLFNNFLPMIGNILFALPGAIVTFVQEATPYFLEAGAQFINQLANGITIGFPNLLANMETIITNAMLLITKNLPLFLEQGIEIIKNVSNGILKSIPQIIESAGNIINTFIRFIMTNLPVILAAGKDLLLSLADGIIKNLPAIVESAIQAISNFIDTIVKNYPEYFKTGSKIIVELITGIVSRLPDLINVALSLMLRFVEMVISKIPDIFSAGKDIVRGLWEGIESLAGWIKDKIYGFVESIGNTIKDFFGINSPSTLMAEYGRYIDEGLAEGIEGNADKPLSAMNKVASGINSTIQTITDTANAAVDAIKGLVSAETMSKITNADSQSGSARNASQSKYEQEKKNFESNYSKEISAYSKMYDVDKSVAAEILKKDLQKSIPKYAQGTNFHPGGLAWVGELGRELINIPRGTQVIPNHQSEKMAKSGDTIINVHNPQPSPSELARQIKKAQQELALGF